MPPIDITGRLLDGRYRVTGPLGRGGMATVWLAQDERLSRQVVVKVPDEALLRDEVFRERFAREVRSLVELEHPNVVRVLDVGRLDEVPYAVMQYLPGGSLKDILDRTGTAQSAESVLAWLGPIADALDSMHERGVVHRDVKPGNILFDGRGRAYLSDFGIAKALDPTESELTRTGQSPGSPGYMPPEILEGRIGTAYDQYSLGAVVLRCLSGEPPPAFASPERLAKALGGRIPPAAAEAIRRAVALEPTDRFPTCRTFMLALKRALEAEPLPAAGPAGTRIPSDEATGTLAAGVVAAASGCTAPPGATAPPATTAPQGAAPPPVIASPSVPVPARRGRGRLAVVGLCVVAAAGLAWLLVRGGGKEEPAHPPVVAGRLVVERPATPETLWGESQFAVAGLLEGGRGSIVLVDGRRAEPGPDGRFVVLLDLAEGPNDIVVRVEGGEERRFRVVRDTTGPEIEAPALARDFVTREKVLTLAGRVVDDHPRRLLVNGAEVPLGPEGAFLLLVPLKEEGVNPVSLEAEDALGNRRSITTALRRDTRRPDVTTEAHPREVPGPGFVVKGKVSEEDAAVFVNGVAAERTGAAFRADVSLKPGHNEILVTAVDRAGNEASPERLSVVRTPDFGQGVEYRPEHLALLKKRAVSRTWSPADPPRNPRGLVELVHTKTGLVFVALPGGGFAMGSTEPGEGPPRQVTVKPFLLCRTECTQAAFAAGGSTIRSRFVGADLPADSVSWVDAVDWCRRNTLRLPSEAEWEYACRAGTATRFSSGDADRTLAGFANVADRSLSTDTGAAPHRDRTGWTYTREIEDGHAGPAPAGRFLPNPFGLFDMHGNLWEWCEDAFVPGYDGAPADGSARALRGAKERACRGGAWAEPAVFARSASRSSAPVADRLDTHGLRPAADLD
jgi:serine/threonine-protein kinase